MSEYSSYPNYNISGIGRNVSNIVDKLIRLTAKITEHYASDIMYDLIEFIDCVENKKEYDKYLLFNESGVTSIKGNTIEEYFKMRTHVDAIQIWHLTHKPDYLDSETTTKLIRMNVSIQYS